LAGENGLFWDCRAADGRLLPAGLSLVRMSIGAQAQSARLAIVR